jgi:hypothetical protein
MKTKNNYQASFTSSPQSKKTQSQKRNSMTCKHPHSPTTKKFKTEPSAEKKTMATVFWDCEGLLLCEFLPSKTTLCEFLPSKLQSKMTNTM